MLGAVVASGRAHVAATDGSEPEIPGAWGWRFSGEEWRPQGERIGWLEASGEDLYLEPEAAYAAVQKQGRDSGDALTITGRTLRKRLHERGLLRSTGMESEGRQTFTVRHTLEGSRKSVLHIAGNFLSILRSGPDQPDHEREKSHSHAQNAPSLWSGPASATGPQPDHEPDHAREQSENGQILGEPWSGQENQTDRKTDQQYPLDNAGNKADGQVGQVTDTERGADSREGVRAHRVRGRL